MELLRQYAEQDSEAACATLVTRHINLVYSVAVRATGNRAAAEEIAQAVFIILARKTRTLHRETILSGWLYQTARLTAANFRRSEIRRVCREQEAYMQSLANETDRSRPDAGEAGAWPQIEPLLDDAMGRLNPKERNAIVLRFFEGKSFQDIGAAFGGSENAAKKRVIHGLEKLRKIFSKHGVTSTTAIIAGVISANSLQAAPITLAKSVTVAALAKGATASASTLILMKGALKLMFWSKAKTAIVGAVIVGAATYSVMQRQAQVKLREQNESLRQQVARLQAETQRLSQRRPTQVLHLPAPQIQVAAPLATNGSPVVNPEFTNLWTRLKDKEVKLTREQVESFLKANGRSAANLLAAYRTSGDPTLLQEAMQNYPNDPQVDFEAAVNNELSPAEQRQWLNAFEKSAPNNALANYLSALNYFNAGEIDRGVQELSAASGKPLDDYSVSRIQYDVEAYLAAGYPMADAKELGGFGILLPQLAQMKQLGLDIVDLANAYRQAGDSGSAEATLQIALNLGQDYTSSPLGINHLVGVAIERAALQAMDPGSPYGSSGQTVQDRLNALAQQRTAFRELSKQSSDLFSKMSDQDWIIYFDRLMVLGEENANRWVVNKYGRR
jgi:RNA polymerase sigma factor (sigma-70 family)